MVTQLGTLALAQGDLTEARRNYLEALQVNQRIGNPHDEAIDWHQLGRVAQEAREWDKAERCYKESLAIKERIGDLALAATTCNQLASVARGAGRPAEAERWYRRAIEVDEKLGNPKGIATCYSNLADLLLAQGRLDEAETYAHRAREIMETLDLSAQPWATYNILAQIAGRRGRADEARQWRRKEQEAFAAFAGSEPQANIRQFDPLIQAIVRALNGDANSRKQVEAMFDQLVAGDWIIVDAIKRVWDGERDVDALTDGIDRNSALIVRRILAVLEGENQPSSPTLPPSHPATGEGSTHSLVGGTPTGEGRGITLPQLLDLVERAARGDAQLGGQLFAAMDDLVQNPAAPQDQRELGKVLLNILAGETSPNLDGLPPELASMVRGLLARLRN